MTAVQAGFYGVLLAGIFVGLVYAGRLYWAWALALGGILAGWAASGVSSPRLFAVAVAVVVVAVAVFGLPPLRQRLLTSWVMRLARRMLPRMGDTERIALEAGTVWWDGELFSGDPDWKKLLDFAPRGLSDRECAFLDGPVQDCARCWTSGRSPRRAIFRPRRGTSSSAIDSSA